MSETRTDAMAARLQDAGMREPDEWQFRYGGMEEFARQLERENGRLKDELCETRLRLTGCRAAREVYKAALDKIDMIARGHPYAGNTCGDIARAALNKEPR
jgi:hypothetical protein